MSVDYFLVDAPHVVPVEFFEWERAKFKHQEILMKAIDAEIGGKVFKELDEFGKAQAVEVVRLKRIAEDAWTAALQRNDPV